MIFSNLMKWFIALSFSVPVGLFISFVLETVVGLNRFPWFDVRILNVLVIFSVFFIYTFTMSMWRVASFNGTQSESVPEKDEGENDNK